MVVLATFDATAHVPHTVVTGISIVEDALHIVCCSTSSVQLALVQPDIKRLNIAGERDVRAFECCRRSTVGDALELVEVADDGSAIAGALVMGDHVPFASSGLPLGA